MGFMRCFTSNLMTRRWDVLVHGPPMASASHLTPCRDPKLRHLDLMLSFSRHRADLLFALNPADVTALARDGTPPRPYHDQRLLSASKRLSLSFACPDSGPSLPAGEGPPLGGQGPASLQDLLRVIQGWTSLDPSQLLPGMVRQGRLTEVSMIIHLYMSAVPFGCGLASVNILAKTMPRLPKV